jgi:hypothetical protein
MQVQVQLAGLPVCLVCDLYTQRVAFVKVSNFRTIIDDVVIFAPDDFMIAGEEFEYNTLYDYKDIPVMLQWLQLQNLQMPVFE